MARSLVRNGLGFATAASTAAAYQALKKATSLAPGKTVGERTARTTIEINASPSDVYAVLADPYSYSDWVVGAKEIRRTEGEWPSKGATFHHTQGTGPLQLKDTTTVLEQEPDVRLLLEVRARPLMTATTDFLLERTRRGTRVTLLETPTAGVLSAVHNDVINAGLRVRNQETLRRLRKQVEG